MARKKAPFRLDEIVEAATDIFIQQGFARARIEQMARRARCSPGTVYLYAASKEALFDLALRRALEDPLALDLPLPVATPSRDEILSGFQRCLDGVCHLPQLWVAVDHPVARRAPEEFEAVLREIWAWLARYRRAILLIRASAADWPGLGHRLEREFQMETTHRLAEYLQRGGEKLHRRFPSPRAAASFLLASLAASALGLGFGDTITGQLPGALDEDAAVAVLVRGMMG